MTDLINPQPEPNPFPEVQPEPEPVPTPDTAEAAESQPHEKRGPGRPRIPEVIDRDNAVLTYLVNTGPAQVRVIAETTNYDKNKVYLSLWRLRKQGKVEYARAGAKRMWSVVA